MRNIIAVILGIITSFFTLLIVFFVLMKFDIGSFRTFALDKFKPDQFSAILNQLRWQWPLIFIPPSFAAGAVAALTAKKKEYLLGLLSILPILLLFFNHFLLDYLFLIMSVFFFTIIGVKTAKLLKGE